jgi:histidine ammonia-lyase
VPDGESVADVLDGWLSAGEPRDERARRVRDALLAAVESGVVAAVLERLDDVDADVGIQLEAVCDEPE